MFNVGSVTKINTDGLTQSCKNVQGKQAKFEVEYVNCPNKPAFLVRWIEPYHYNAEIHDDEYDTSTTQEFAANH